LGTPYPNSAAERGSMPGATQPRNSLDYPRPCEHLSGARSIKPHSTECLECLDLGCGWVALWRCLSCGWVACSNDSPNKHAKAHYQETDHPVARSLEPDPGQCWCYVHQRTV
jgi:uncharacterized UBP type Zn finger protein